jgi:hypothetical protein
MLRLDHPVKGEVNARAVVMTLWSDQFYTVRTQLGLTTA